MTTPLVATDLIPTLCPSCQKPLVLSSTKVDLICPNFENCPAQIVGRLTYFTSRGNANIEGLSEKTLSKFIDKQNLSDIPGIFNLDYESAKSWEGFGDKSINKLQESIDKCRAGIIDYRFLTGLGIEGIGPEVAKLILEKMNLYSAATK